MEKKTGIYTSINKLPLARFIDCLCDGDLTVLVISGEPTPEELYNAWATILEDYQDAVGGDDQERYVVNAAELRQHQIRLYRLKILVEILEKVGYIEKFAGYLRKIIHKPIPSPLVDRATYEDRLKTARAWIPWLEMKIEDQQRLLKEILDDSTKGNVKPTRVHFEQTLITLSDHAGRDLDPETLTTYAYCERIRRYNKFVQQQTNKRQNRWAQSEGY